MTKGIDERVDKFFLHWFGHVKRMENDRIAKRLYVGECADSHSVGRPQKRWIDTVKDCFKKELGCQTNKQGEWCRIEVNSRGL